MAIQSTDTRPWFKQFWPWFLILLPASVVVAATATLIIANRGADDLVAQEYYKDGLAINRRLEKEQRAVTLGVTGSLAFEQETVTANIASPAAPNTLVLSMSHPMEADRDFVVTLDHVGGDAYRGVMPVAIEGNWHWSLEPGGDAAWQLNGVVGRDTR